MLSKFAFSLVFGVLASTATLSASLVDCPSAPPPAQTVDTTATPGPSSYTLSCGGLTFSNFEVVDAGTTLPSIVNLVEAKLDTAARVVYLNFNPNLLAWPGTVEDIHFYFKVSGPLTGIDLAVGGTSSAITERACSTGINRNAGNNCIGGISNQLAAITNVSGQSAITETFAMVNTAYIFKDVLADGRRSRGGAELTTFSQSFHTPVPEPMSLGLMGGGLVTLALLRKRAVRS